MLQIIPEIGFIALIVAVFIQPTQPWPSMSLIAATGLLIANKLILKHKSSELDEMRLKIKDLESKTEAIILNSGFSKR